MTMNQSCYALKGLYGDFFTYYTISEEVDWLKQNAHGAVFDTITRTTFKEISIVLLEFRVSNIVPPYIFG